MKMMICPKANMCRKSKDSCGYHDSPHKMDRCDDFCGCKAIKIVCIPYRRPVTRQREHPAVGLLKEVVGCKDLYHTYTTAGNYINICVPGALWGKCRKMTEKGMK